MNYNVIIELSNKIRFIVETSRQVQIASVNAALAGRQVGNVKGFQAVAGELKVFSQKLENEMSTMSQHIFGLAKSLSNLYRQDLDTRHHQRALSTTDSNTIIRQILDRDRELKQSQQNELRSNFKDLQTHLSRSKRLCNSGRALARAAMVEAVYGGDGVEILKQVAHDIDDTVHAIYHNLMSIEGELDINGGIYC